MLDPAAPFSGAKRPKLTTLSPVKMRTAHQPGFTVHSRWMPRFGGHVSAAHNPRVDTHPHPVRGFLWVLYAGRTPSPIPSQRVSRVAGIGLDTVPRPTNRGPAIGDAMGQDQFHALSHDRCESRPALLVTRQFILPSSLPSLSVPLTAIMPCEEPCNGCTNTCADRTLDIEDYKTELTTLQARTKELEAKIANLTTSASQSNGTNGKPALRSAQWFDRPDDRGMAALYMDRYLNYGLTREELMSGKPIIGIAQSGSDIAPCNRYHLTLAKRVREGIRSAGGIAFEFPTHPIQESTRRPTATLDRNLSYLTLVELLYAYPFDGVVLLTGCDKTTPACLMAAATVNIP
jgi:hypothetical protein